MCTSPVLVMPDFEQSFTLETYVSDARIGAVLMQNGKPIAYFSKALCQRSLSLSTYEKELMTLVAAVQKWRHYLQGNSFIVKTDHLSLKYLLEQRLNHSLQQRSMCKLLGFDYTIQYKKGSENRVADALSRREEDVGFKAECNAVTELIPTWIEELKGSYENDEWAQQILREDDRLGEGHIAKHQGVIRVKGRLYVGQSHGWRCKIITWMHDSHVGGHSGMLGTYQRAKRMFYWKKMKEDILTHVRRCEVCQLNKHENKPPAGLLDPITVLEGAWQVISMDFICGLPMSDHKEVIMVVIDKFTKYGHFIPLSHPYTAVEVARVFLEQIYRLHGLPNKIITDRDPIFTSVFWKELMNKLDIKLNLSTAYHPQTDGQTERLNQCLEQYLRCMIGQSPRQWVKWLYLAELWYNSNHHIAIQMSPFKALYGYEPPNISLGSVPGSHVEAVDEVLRERQTLIQQLKMHLH
jgi:transposase InsO family protein